MGRVEEAVRTAIARAVRRECRAAYAPLVAEVRDLKRRVARLGRDVASLQGRAGQRVAVGAGLGIAGAPDEETSRARLTPAAVKALRARLGVTQVQLAALLGVTGPAVAQWEGGTSAPRGSHRAALVALRKLGRREVSRMLGAGGERR